MDPLLAAAAAALGLLVMDWSYWAQACVAASYLVETDDWRRPLPMWRERLKVRVAAMTPAVASIAGGSSGRWPEYLSVLLLVGSIVVYVGVAGFVFYGNLRRFYDSGAS